MNSDNYLERNRELEKANRILQKKLERCEKERKQLETDITGKEFLLKQVNNELENSQSVLASRSEELEITLQNLQAMQAKMLQSEKMSALGQIVAGVAHEINNPVNFIHANISYLKEYSEDTLQLIKLYQSYFPNPPSEIQTLEDDIDLEFLQADSTKILQSMKVGTGRIHAIVLSLRNFSRFDEAELKAVDVHQGIDNTLIADTGVGIPESIQSQIFNPFFTTKPVGKGTGMGLAISYQIVCEKHGGKLDCFSTIGKGTEFRIQIPIQ